MCSAATVPVSQCQAGVDQHAMTILHQPMPDEAQLGLLAFALPVEPGMSIGVQILQAE
jgi:hypothetical protein